MTRIYFTRPGHKDLGTLSKDLQERVKSKLRDARADPARHLKHLQGYDLFSIRVGDHRVILDWNKKEDTLYIHAIAHRRNIYDRRVKD